MNIRWLSRLLIACGLAALAIASGSAIPATRAQSDPAQVALAYVLQDTVVLADARGNPLVQTGPEFTWQQGARLFWTADAETLYIARNDQLFVTGATGGAAAPIAMNYGRTLTISQDGAELFYLDTTEPTIVPQQDANAPDRVAFPLRRIALDAVGSRGGSAGYFGEYNPDAATAEIAFAEALYARDAGLLGPGRPNLWPTYGANIFGTCCFPDPGLGVLDTNRATFSIFDPEFMPGAAAINLTRTHLAGPTTTGAIRVIDLITGGTRDYMPQISGTTLPGGVSAVERIAWSPDDTYLYLVVRQPASNPLELTTNTSFPADTRSADVILFRLNLVNSELVQLAYRRDVFGVSSLAATDQYVFATVVDPNTTLLQKLNARQVRPGSSPTDPALHDLWPTTHLWRVDINGDSAQDVAANAWGVVARPVR